MTKKKITYTPEELLEMEFPYPYPYFKKVSVYVHEVYGCCPIVVEGDKLVFDNGSLLLDESEISSHLPLYFEGRPVICSVAHDAFFRYVKPMCYGISAIDLGIAKEGEDGYVMCAAWGPPTCEAAVIFRLHAEPMEKGWDDRWNEYLSKIGHVCVPTFYHEKFASKETKEERERLIEEWEKAGSPKFWSGWKDSPCQPKRRNR